MELLVTFDFLPKIGGAHYWMYEQYRSWPAPVRAVTALPSADPGERAGEHAFDAEPHGALTIARVIPARDAHINLTDPRYWWACLRQVRAIAGQATAPVTHLHVVRAFPEGLAALFYRRTLARPARLVTYAHGEEILVARTSRQLTTVAKAVYAASDLVIVNSEGTRRLVTELCPSARTVRISPGVDAASYRLPREPVERYRASWGWPAETVAIATVARMEPRKNQSMVVRAVAELRAKGLQVGYFCAGDGEERGRLLQMRAELGIEPWVKMPGPISDAEKRLALAACDIHAMPSIQVGPMIEGFGIVFVEAAAAGAPSIAGNTGGQTEAVVHDQTGLVVDGTRLAEVCQALERLVTNAPLRASLGSAGQRWAQQHDWNLVARAAYMAINQARGPK